MKLAPCRENGGVAASASFDLRCQRQPRRPPPKPDLFEDEFEDRFEDEFEDLFDEEFEDLFDDEFEELFEELLPATCQRSPACSVPLSWVGAPVTPLGA